MYIPQTIENNSQITEYLTKESKVEDKFCNYLDRNRISYFRQYHCPAGIVDVLTDDYVFEVKVNFDRGNIFAAVGQAIIYSKYVEFDVKPAIVSQKRTFNGSLLPLVADMGIKIVLI